MNRLKLPYILVLLSILDSAKYTEDTMQCMSIGIYKHSCSMYVCIFIDYA